MTVHFMSLGHLLQPLDHQWLLIEGYVLPHYLRGLQWFQMHGLSGRLMHWQKRGKMTMLVNTAQGRSRIWEIIWMFIWCAWCGKHVLSMSMDIWHLILFLVCSSDYGNAYMERQGIAHKTVWDLWHNELALFLIAVFFLVLTYIQLRRIQHHR